jgi:hypothetical protein
MFTTLWNIYGGELNVSWLNSLMNSVESSTQAAGIDIRDFKRACRTLPLLSEWVDMGFGPLSLTPTTAMPSGAAQTLNQTDTPSATSSSGVLPQRGISRTQLPQPQPVLSSQK